MIIKTLLVNITKTNSKIITGQDLIPRALGIEYSKDKQQEEQSIIQDFIKDLQAQLLYLKDNSHADLWLICFKI